MLGFWGFGGILVVTASGGLYEITSGGTKQLYAGAAFEDASGCKVLDFAATQAINNGRVQQTREKQNSHAHAFARRDLVKTCSRLVDFVIESLFPSEYDTSPRSGSVRAWRGGRSSRRSNTLSGCEFRPCDFESSAPRDQVSRLRQ